ncbi:MAG TPA: amino acid permease C-terminal domain-containing protein, partial [Gammaproteobacteria bacterium]
ILGCIYLIMNLSPHTWTRFSIWLAAGLIIYFAYSYRHSRLNGNGNGSDRPAHAPLS